MTLLPMLLAGHFIGDWILQTDRQALGKTTSWRLNQAHMWSYHVALFWCIVWITTPGIGLAILAVSWLTHSFIDRRWPVKWLMRKTGSAPFAETLWGVICVDQALHLSILCILGAIFA